MSHYQFRMAGDISLFGDTRPWLHLLYRFDIDLAGYCYWTFISVKRMCKTCNTRKNFSNRRFWSLAIFWFHNRFHGKICEQHQRQRFSKNESSHHIKYYTLTTDTLGKFWYLKSIDKYWKLNDELLLLTNITRSCRLLKYCLVLCSFPRCEYFLTDKLSECQNRKNRNQKIGCKIANNWIKFYYSRKTPKPKQ